jgi:hypothetical protein
VLATAQVGNEGFQTIPDLSQGCAAVRGGSRPSRKSEVTERHDRRNIPALKLLEAALRVLACYRDRTNPDPADVRLLRAASHHDHNALPPDDLAVQKVGRETEHLSRKGVSRASQAGALRPKAQRRAS